MAEVNLSTLSGPELRHLLDATRNRGQASLSYQILQEMAARREGRRRQGLKRRPQEPRIIALDLGDPLEPEDDDLPPVSACRAPAAAIAAPPPAALDLPPVAVAAPRRPRRRKTPPRPAPAGPAASPSVEVEPLPRPAVAEEPPLRVWDDPELFGEATPEDDALRLGDPPRHDPPPPRRRGPGAGAAFAVGIAAGLALGWWAAGASRETPWRATVSSRLAALALRPAAAAPPAAAAQPPLNALPVPPVAVASSPKVAVRAVEPASSPASAEREAVAPVETAKPAAPAAGACAAEPTPADRTICGDPQLRRLQRELRQAYAQALAAHQDRALLREHQLAWRDARDGVTAPDRLARLYEDRIRKLNAATAAARQSR